MSKYKEQHNEGLLATYKEWIACAAVVSLGQAVGRYYLGRYHTRKKSLKFLGICYYISRFMGKAKLWLRKIRLKRAAKVSGGIRVATEELCAIFHKTPSG